MSDLDHFSEETVFKTDIKKWVQGVDNNTSDSLERQATASILYALAAEPRFSDVLYLKGGTLMIFAFQSSRRTADIDFTCTDDARNFEENLRALLDPALNRARILLGFTDIMLKLQKIVKKPKPEGFPDAFRFPAFEIKIGYANKSSRQAERLAQGLSVNVIRIDTSFNERIYRKGRVLLSDTGVAISTYSYFDVLAEKIRALIQQCSRNHLRVRRQDIYDISWLVKMMKPNAREKSSILSTILQKCSSHDIPVDQYTFRNDDLKEASRRGWETLELEIDLPDFDECYDIVRDFFESLPWERVNHAG